MNKSRERGWKRTLKHEGRQTWTLGCFTWTNLAHYFYFLNLSVTNLLSFSIRPAALLHLRSPDPLNHLHTRPSFPYYSLSIYTSPFSPCRLWPDCLLWSVVILTPSCSLFFCLLTVWFYLPQMSPHLCSEPLQCARAVNVSTGLKLLPCRVFRIHLFWKNSHLVFGHWVQYMPSPCCAS